MDFEEVSSQLTNWAFNKRWLLLFGLLGLLFLGLGVFSLGQNILGETKVEILGSEADGEVREIRVEIAGQVQNPGVYEIKGGARVDDLLILAGGLSAQADRAWVEKNLNRAGKLVDGQKVYVPKLGETTVYGLQSTAGKNSAAVGSQSTVSNKININSASLKELDSLEGIGAVRAQAIIDNRPYSTIDELSTKKIIPKSIFEKIKDEIVAF